MRIFRLIKIIFIFYRYGLYQIFKKPNLLIYSFRLLFFYLPVKHKNLSQAARIRLAFEELGPVYIKFGQILSTRQDIIPAQYVIELSKLQNQVKPFPGIIARKIVEESLNNKIENIFSNFSAQAVASASIAQVHSATLLSSGEKVAVKVLRPNISLTINKDIKVLQLIAWLVEKIFIDGKRLKPQEVIEEFKRTINAELDFLQEAANATELHRLHRNDLRIIIPKVYFDYSNNQIIVLEWMDGIPIANLALLQENNIDKEKLSHNGVAIFYTEVFNYGFFHADMHPGNIMCDKEGRYIALDFGIVGCLSEEDKRYLAINIWAFFNRDYKKVALTHVESGWAPPETSIEELEGAIRSVCEPIFNKPLSQISFGQVLIKLFQISRRFGIIVQPQLVLLQKTIINVEGLGRLLNPDLDLWVTAKPILEKWMREQMGLMGFFNNIKKELPYWSYTLPLLPRLYANALQKNSNHYYIKDSYKQQNKLLIIIILLLIIFILFK